MSLDKALEALKTAASIYEKSERQSTRAARIYEILAEQYKKTSSTEYNLEKALKVFEFFFYKMNDSDNCLTYMFFIT